MSKRPYWVEKVGNQLVIIKDDGGPPRSNSAKRVWATSKRNAEEVYKEVHEPESQ